VNVKQLTYELHMSEKRIDRAHAELSLAIHLRTASKVDGMAARVHSMDRRTANRLEGIEVALQRLSTQGSDVLTPITPAHSEGQQQWQQLLQGAGSGGTVDPQASNMLQASSLCSAPTSLQHSSIVRLIESNAPPLIAVLCQSLAPTHRRSASTCRAWRWPTPMRCG
jgi:hypothetical protein